MGFDRSITAESKYGEIPLRPAVLRTKSSQRTSGARIAAPFECPTRLASDHPLLADYSPTASRCRMSASNGLHPAEADPKQPVGIPQS